MVVSGHSAGGQLAAMALATDWPGLDAALPGDMIAAAITLSPLVELAPLRKVPFLQADLHLTDALVAGCSPIRHAPAHAAPILAAVGGRESDEFKRQLKLLVEAWPQCHSRIVPMPDDDHLSICEAFGRAGTLLHAAALALLTAKRQLAASLALRSNRDTPRKAISRRLAPTLVLAYSEWRAPRKTHKEEQ